MLKISNLMVLVASLLSFKVFGAEKKPWVYFDLGDTIISTKDMNHLKYMPGAREYMDELHREGFKIGIISNIPENWGMDYEEKLQSLKKVISEGWDEERPFDWGAYDEIILPLKNTEMKPTPTLFLKAIMKAESCPSMYIGESQKEVNAAINAGMAAKIFKETDESIYIPVLEVKGFIKDNYRLDYDKNCL
jgi:phosphoglycolate phosphatase-like HAD superfamily hydrolase